MKEKRAKGSKNHFNSTQHKHSISSKHKRREEIIILWDEIVWAFGRVGRVSKEFMWIEKLDIEKKKN
jgi:hypothetical protein